MSAALPLDASAAAPPSCGTVFGFEVHSTLPFQALRNGTGEPLFVVAPSRPGLRPDDELLIDIDRRNFRAKIFGNGLTYKLWVGHAGWFEIDPRERSISVPEGLDPVLREELLWGVPALLCFLHRGDLSLHAAAVEVAGEAILLAAQEAHGKSTLAAAFAQRGCRLLSEDLTCVRFGDGCPSLVPGPATLRLRNDIGSQVPVDFGRHLAGGADRLRYALRNELRGDCTPVPIRKVFFLRTSDDGIRAERIRGVESLPDLWRFSFRITPAQKAACFERIADLARDVPIHNLIRPLRLDALDPTVDFVLSHS